MSSGQIVVIIGVIIAIYLDWLIMKWLQNKQLGVVGIKAEANQRKNFSIQPFLSVVKQKTSIPISWWNKIRPFIFDSGEENLSRQPSQAKDLPGVYGGAVPPIQNRWRYVLKFTLPIVLIIASIVLMQRGALAAGAILLAVVFLLFLRFISPLGKNDPVDKDLDLPKPHFISIAGLMLLVSFGLTLTLILNITHYVRTPELNRAATIEWILSILTLTVGVLWAADWKPAHPRDIWEWIKLNRFEFGLASLIMIGGLAIRIVALTQHPYPWSGDEASVGLDAVHIIHGESTDLFDVGWSGQPNVSFLPTAFSILIFGRTIFAIKMVSVVTGTLSILALYLLAREWFGNTVALIASGFLIAYPFHLQFSRIGVDNIIDSLMAPLVIWLIFRAVRLKSLPAYLLAGIASGLTIYTYVGTRLVLAMAIGTLVYIAITQKHYLRDNLPQLGIYLAGLVVTVAPMATFFIQRPDLFMTRLGQEGIFLNGWLASQVQLTGESIWQIMLDQFSRTTLVFFAQNTGTNFLNFDRPYLTILGAVFFLVGLMVAFRHFFDQRYFILSMWFWSVLALGGFLTVSPPANTRLVMTIPATALFIALGVWQTSNILFNLKFKRIWIYSLYFLLIFILAYQNLSFYFGSYRQERHFQDANGELGMETGLQLQELGENYDFYLFGSPRVFANFPITDFLTPNNPKYDIGAESISELSIDPKRGAYFVAIPENQKSLQQIMNKYPHGSFEAITREMATEVLYYAYILPPRIANSQIIKKIRNEQ